MLNSRRRDSSITDDSHLDRWLVSYADYMTLLFAVFVVLYAFALEKEEKYSVLSQSLGEIFHLSGSKDQGAQGVLKQNSTADLLNSGDKISDLNQYNKGLLTEVGSEPVAGDSQLVNTDASLMGTPFSSMKEKLATDLLEVIEKGYAKIEQDDNWLTIEFRSGLLFESGSANPRRATHFVIKKVIKTIAPANNFVHVRGYTDDQAINNEQFSSNWQLSSARASAIVQILQGLDVAPQRLAIEAYGQYKPKVLNDSVSHRATNRRVVIAISRYGWEPDLALVKFDVAAPIKKQPKTIADSEKMQIIELPNGGLRITTRKEE
ncbi:MAG: OmpA family protein [Psychrobium sp.]|nr:OmpA family protein [Psychrobium sp.]